MYADDTTLVAKSEELKILFVKVKEENAEVGVILNTQKMKLWYPTHHFMENRWGKNGK